MKRYISIACILMFILSISTTAFAANAVPSEVVSACDSVVRIYADYGDEYALGSGFVISNDNNETLIVTNHHVAVEDNPKELLVLLNVDTDIQATVVASDESKDLAVIKVAFPLVITPVTFANEPAKKGDAIYTIGYPGAADAFSNEIAVTQDDSTITDGIVSAVRSVKLTENGTDTEVLQVTAAINSGNSGGPVVNEKGEVVGISSFGVDDSQGIFGAVSVDEIKKFLDSNGISYQTTGIAVTTETSKGNGLKIIFPIVGGVVLLTIIVVVIIGIKNNKQDSSKESATKEFETEQEKPIKKAQINKKLVAVICIGIIVLGLVCTYFYKYNKAVEFAKAGDTSAARECLILEKITNLHDLSLLPYLDALDALDAGEYKAAEEAFIALGDYLNAKDNLAFIDDYKEQKYQQALGLLDCNDYDNAYSLFVELDGYKDSNDKTSEIKLLEDRYNEAEVLYAEGKYNPAKQIYVELAKRNYRDSKEKANKCEEAYILGQLEKGEWADAIRLFNTLSKENEGDQTIIHSVLSSIYDRAIVEYHNGNFDAARSMFNTVDENSKNYKDVSKYLELSRYSQLLNEEYEDFINDFLSIGTESWKKQHFKDGLSTLEGMNGFENSQLLYSKMLAWYERYEREKQEESKKSEVSSVKDYSQILNANFIGTWVRSDGVDTLILTENGAYVKIDYLGYDGTQLYEWELIDRSDRDKCPHLAIYTRGRGNGSLSYYVSGINANSFWSDSQGHTFYRQ